jgi:hypothetical protein
MEVFVKIEEFVGQTFTSIEGMVAGENEITFTSAQGTFVMYHSQDCCEQVSLDDVCGDVEDLIGVPIMKAYCETNRDLPPKPTEYGEDSWTWTFYRLSTIRGTVTLRWYGSSNGY